MSKFLTFDFGFNILIIIMIYFVLNLQNLTDPLNYGFYMPPLKGKAGKFLDEERVLRDYPAESYGDHLEVFVTFFSSETETAVVKRSISNGQSFHGIIIPCIDIGPFERKWHFDFSTPGSISYALHIEIGVAWYQDTYAWY